MLKIQFLECDAYKHDQICNGTSPKNFGQIFQRPVSDRNSIKHAFFRFDGCLVNPVDEFATFEDS